MSGTKLLDRAAKLRSSNSHAQIRRLVDSVVHATGQSLVSNAKSQSAYFRLIRQVFARSNLLQPNRLDGARRLGQIKMIVGTCAQLSHASSRWRRTPEDWDNQARDLKANLQLRALIDHLLMHKEVPRFLYQGWFGEVGEEHRQMRRLFMHLAAGHSIRGTEVGKELTREMAERIYCAPHDATLNEAIRFARTGNPINLPREFPIGTSRRRSKTWLKSRRTSTTRWDRIPVDDFSYTAEINHHQCKQRTWIIRQLTHRNQLNHEGKRMKHCVAAYWTDCIEGTSSIWSMESRDALRSRGLLTIEIAPESMEIVQIKGFLNRGPRKKEMEIIERWCEAASLKINLLW